MDAKGWKTKTASIMGGFYGLMSIAGNVLLEPNPEWALGMGAAGALIIAAFGVFGLGDKIRKLIEAIQGK